MLCEGKRRIRCIKGGGRERERSMGEEGEDGWAFSLSFPLYVQCVCCFATVALIDPPVGFLVSAGTGSDVMGENIDPAALEQVMRETLGFRV